MAKNISAYKYIPLDFRCFPSIACDTSKGKTMKIRKYQDIAPSNRTNFAMVYHHAGRTLTQIETILKLACGNLHAIQKAHSLPLTDIDGLNAVPLSIEMDTGTGKTFVYTKTILELNKRYDFTKFIIVVPSVAIREGVNKSFQATEEYFKNQYDSVPYR